MTNDTKEALATAKQELTRAIRAYALARDPLALQLIQIYSGTVLALVQLAQLEEREPKEKSSKAPEPTSDPDDDFEFPSA